MSDAPPVLVRAAGHPGVWVLLSQRDGLVELAGSGRRLVVPETSVVRVDEPPPPQRAV